MFYSDYFPTKHIPNSSPLGLGCKQWTCSEDAQDAFWKSYVHNFNLRMLEQTDRYNSGLFDFL